MLTGRESKKVIRCRATDCIICASEHYHCYIILIWQMLLPKETYIFTYRETLEGIWGSDLAQGHFNVWTGGTSNPHDEQTCQTVLSTFPKCV